MANTAAICASFKSEILSGIHALGTTVVRAAATADVLKGALFLASGALGPATTAYAVTSEVSGVGYVAGGMVIPNTIPPTVAGTSGIWTPSSSLVWTNVTLATPFDTLLVYNSTQGNKAIEVLTFGSQTLTAGTLTLNMPANDATHALIQLI